MSLEAQHEHIADQVWQYTLYLEAASRSISLTSKRRWKAVHTCSSAQLQDPEILQNKCIEKGCRRLLTSWKKSARTLYKKAEVAMIPVIASIFPLIIIRILHYQV